MINGAPNAARKDTTSPIADLPHQSKTSRSKLTKSTLKMSTCSFNISISN